MSEDFDEQLDAFMDELDADATTISITIVHNGKTFGANETLPMGFPVNTVMWAAEEMLADINKMMKKAEE